MKTLRTISLICYALIGLLGFVFASMYLFRHEFMPYHAVAVGKSWDQVDPAMRVLILALMRVSGGGWLATSVSITLMLIGRLRFKKIYFGFTLVMTGLAALIPTLIATLYVRFNSPADPPTIAAILGIIVLVAALILDAVSNAKLKESNR